jgi:hypothetical protein
MLSRVVITVARRRAPQAAGGKKSLIYFGIINLRDQSAVVSAIYKGMFVSIQKVYINGNYRFPVQYRARKQAVVLSSSRLLTRAVLRC